MNIVKLNEQKNNMIRYVALGGGNEPFGACYLLSFNGIHVLIDCGIRFNSDMQYPDYSYLTRLLGSWTELDIVLLTHAHVDHCGAILPILDNVPLSKIMASNETKGILQRTLYYQIRYETETEDKKWLREINRQKQKLNNRIGNIETFKFNRPIEIEKQGDQLSIVPVSSGHVFGGASFIFDFNSDKVFFTGDYTLEQLYTTGNMQKYLK